MRDLGARTTRLRVAAATALFTIVTAACSQGGEDTTSSLPFTVPTTTTTQPPQTTTTGASYLWESGDCLNLGTDATLAELPYAPYGTEPVVECSDPHTHEVYYTSVFGGDLDAPYPADIQEGVQDTCTARFAEVIGSAPSESTLEIVRYWPDSDEWAAGERYQACLAYLPAAEFTYRDLIGSLEGSASEHTWRAELGDCIDEDFWSIRIGSPVSCEEPHAFELVGVIDHPGLAGSAYPGRDAMADYGRDGCAGAAREYAGRDLLDEPVSVLATPTIINRAGWELGIRRVSCYAYVATPDLGLFDVLGTLQDGPLEILGPRLGDQDEGITAGGGRELG